MAEGIDLLIYLIFVDSTLGFVFYATFFLL